jgi:hypothetical protein
MLNFKPDLPIFVTCVASFDCITLPRTRKQPQKQHHIFKTPSSNKKGVGKEPSWGIKLPINLTTCSKISKI